MKATKTSDADYETSFVSTNTKCTQIENLFHQNASFFE